MKEIINRLSTSIILLLVLFFSYLYENAFLLLLIIIMVLSIFEFSQLLDKIKKIKNKKTLLIFSSIYLLLTFYLLYLHMPENKDLIFFLIIICISTDIGGLVFGKIFKGKKLTKISPKKTYSGLVGAYSLSIFFPTLIFNNFFSLYYIIMFSIIVSTVSQSGDLFISYLKRKAKIKDTGKFLPGHGGLLDRLDGIIFSIPLGLTINFYI